MVSQVGGVTYSNTAAIETKVLVIAGAVLVFNFTCFNPSGTLTYVQFFDAAATADVTLGTTTPKFVLPLPAGGGIDTTYELPRRFRLGLVYAVTATATGSGAPAGANVVQLDYMGG